MASLNTREIVLLNTLAMGLNGDLEVVNVITGKTYPCAAATGVEHISVPQSNDDRVLTWNGQLGRLEIFSVLSEEK